MDALARRGGFRRRVQPATYVAEKEGAMRQFIITAAATLMVSAAYADDDIERVSMTLDLASFERIEVSGVYDVTVSVGGDFSVAISGPADEVDLVEARVKNGVLDLSQKERKKRWGRNNRHGVDAVISLPRLDAFEVSGVVDGRIKDIDADHFDLAISGVGDITLAGRCDSLDAKVSGVGDLDAEDFKCRVVDVTVSGVGDATVYASDEVEASVSGMGSIDVYGGPERVTKSDSLFAEVTIH